jgi:hypothetical protein
MVILRRHSISERLARMFRVFIKCGSCLKIKRKSYLKVLGNLMSCPFGDLANEIRDHCKMKSALNLGRKVISLSTINT